MDVSLSLFLQYSPVRIKKQVMGNVIIPVLIQLCPITDYILAQWLVGKLWPTWFCKESFTDTLACLFTRILSTVTFGLQGQI